MGVADEALTDPAEQHFSEPTAPAAAHDGQLGGLRRANQGSTGCLVQLPGSSR